MRAQPAGGSRCLAGGGVQTALAAAGCRRHRPPARPLSSPLRRLGGEVQQASSSKLASVCATCWAGGRRFLCRGALQGECCCFWPPLVQGGVAPRVFVVSCIARPSLRPPRPPAHCYESVGTRVQRLGVATPAQQAAADGHAAGAHAALSGAANIQCHAACTAGCFTGRSIFVVNTVASLPSHCLPQSGVCTKGTQEPGAC